jgi:hypothetical protein
MPSMDCTVVSKCECCKLYHQVFLCKKSCPFFCNSQALNSITGLKSISLKHREGSCMIFLVEKVSGTGSLYMLCEPFVQVWNDSCICANLLCKYEMIAAFVLIFCASMKWYLHLSQLSIVTISHQGPLILIENQNTAPELYRLIADYLHLIMMWGVWSH